MSKSGTVKEKSWGSLGGNNPMHSFNGVGTQVPGQSAQEGSGGRREQRANGGPGNVMSSDNSKGTGSTKHGNNRYGAGPQVSGAKQEGFAHGGTTRMHGNTGSRRAVGGQSSQP
jgi:hypothetical protein